MAGGLSGAACAWLGLLLGALTVVFRVALTGGFFADAALAVGLVATFTTDLREAVDGLAEAVPGVAEGDVAIMMTRLSKLTLHTVYTVNFKQARL